MPDPRLDRTKKHALTDILLITSCAAITGAGPWDSVAVFGKSKRDWLGKFVPLAAGIPSPDTFGRVFARLDPKAFRACAVGWLGAACEATGLEPVAVDGGAARGTHGPAFGGCLHLVDAWAVGNRMILGREAAADKSNEITAIPKLPDVLDLTGAPVTTDAAGCRTEVARKIRDRGGDYLPAVTGNRPALAAAARAVVERALATESAGVAADHHQATEDGRGRHEERYVAAASDPDGLPPDRPDVAAVVLAGGEREVNGKDAGSGRVFTTSRGGTAAESGQFVRRHWAVESESHWRPDVTFGEDASRVATGHAGTNLGLIRRVAWALLGQAPGKGSGPTKRLQAALDEDYLEQGIQGNAAN